MLSYNKIAQDNEEALKSTLSIQAPESEICSPKHTKTIQEYLKTHGKTTLDIGNFGNENRSLVASFSLLEPENIIWVGILGGDYFTVDIASGKTA